MKRGVSRLGVLFTCGCSFIFADDAEVKNNQLNNAFISWYVILKSPAIPSLNEIFRYFTLAHEIAHNLVQPHNSEHEFYFSAICEKYLLSLGKLLSGPS